MQVKTIRKNIEKKMEQWLQTITDEKLRAAVKNSLLVSGGCITSMFLNEEINDYDVYLKDREVLTKLTEYYANSYLNIRVLDGFYKERYLAELPDGVDNSESRVVKNLKKDQVKIFLRDNVGGMRVNENIVEEDLKYLPVFFSPNAVSLSNNIQIITRFFGDNEEIHKNFDFVHATNYFTCEKGLVTNKEALESTLTKQLKYQGSLYPLTSIIRMKKFVKRNWNINAGELLKIMFQISELDLHDYDVLEDQLIGIDVAYFTQLIEILRSIPDIKITSGYLNVIIDKVFNDSEDTGI